MTYRRKRLDHFFVGALPSLTPCAIPERAQAMLSRCKVSEARTSRRAIRAPNGIRNCGAWPREDKEPLAKKLGAHHYIDSDVVDPIAELKKLGGARVILATA